MTLVAPGRRPTEPIGLSLSPSAGLAAAAAVPAACPVRLTGAARLGAALLLVSGLLLQRTVLTLLPWGPADLVTVLVAGLGLYAGPVAGCFGGFGIGLAADALSDHALGRLAAVLCVVGYLSGMLATDAGRRLRTAWLAIGASTVLTPLLFALTGAFVGDDRAAGMLLVTRCVAGLGYGLVLAPIAYLLIRRLLAPRRHRARPGRPPSPAMR